MNFLYIFLLSIYLLNNKFVNIINDNFRNMSGINGVFLCFKYMYLQWLNKTIAIKKAVFEAMRIYTFVAFRRK